MEKIRIFVLTLLCMVGFMHLCAQDVVTKNIGETETLGITVGTNGTGVLGNDDRTNCSWISKSSFDKVGNCLVLDSDGSLDNAIVADDVNLSFGVSGFHEISLRLFAPLGWVVDGISFTAHNNGSWTILDTNNVTITCNGKSYTVAKNGGTKDVVASGMSSSVVLLKLQTGQLVPTLFPYVAFRNFQVTLKKVGTPAEPINGVDESTITTGTTDEDKVRHWAWKQEVPTPGTSYKVVNGSSTSGNLIVIGQKNNSTIETKDDDHDEDDDYDQVEITDNIEEGGEWLYGSDYTLTNYTDRVVGFYESHVDGQGYSKSTQWRVSPLAIGDASGFAISNKSSLKIIGDIDLARYYLKLSEVFASVNMGDLGWNAAPNENIFIWNFYSLDQYKCYIAYKDAYNDFKALAELIENNPGIKDESYYKKYTDLLTEIDNIPAQGYDEETRAATYDRIRRMLDLIATIKIDYGTEDSGTQVGLVNHDAEAVGGTTGWSTSTVTGPTGSFSATEGGRDGSAHKFELSNLRMYQEVKADPKNSFILEPGVYYASVYWKASAGDKFMFEVVGEFDKQSTGELVGEGLNGEWKYALLELVVVTDTRITISATHKGDGQAYIDDFGLRRFCQNYYRDDAATKTRVYKGLFNTKFNSKTSEKNNIEEKDKDGKVITKFLDLGPIASVTEEYPYADITKLAFYSKIQFDNTENPNGLVYANPYRVNVKGTTNAANNVIIAGEDGLECEKLVLQNGYPYSTKWTFTANDAEYTMNAFGVGIDDTKGKVAYGTLILPYDVDANTITANGVEVYKPTAIDAKGHLKLQKSTTISADVPYIVKYTDADAQTKLFNAFSESKTVKPCGMVVDDGLLVGTYEKTKVPYADGNCYLLQLQNGKLAFYPVKKDGLYCNPFRCYLKLPVGTNPSKVSFVFEDDETTGVTEIENAICADEIYDLSGRRVENMTRPGVYVKNGKKVLVK